jgi:hypothetical protein
MKAKETKSTEKGNFDARILGIVLAVLTLAGAYKVLRPEVIDIYHDAKLLSTKKAEEPKTTLNPAAFFARGIGASPGRITGTLWFDPQSAAKAKLASPVPVVLVCDHPGVHDLCLGIADALILLKEDSTSSAARTAAMNGKPCICKPEFRSVGSNILEIVDGALKAGDFVTIDGDAGLILRVVKGALAKSPIIDLPAPGRN